MLSEFETSLADVAQNEYDRYHGYDENDPILASRIKVYWTSVKDAFPGVSMAWSAVFVSWCLKSAGATKSEFRFSKRHSEFVFWAIQNAEAGFGLFRGYPIMECAPSVGDIVHLNRPNKSLTFQYAATHEKYESHSAIVVATGHDSSGRFALTIGGNEDFPGSVRRRKIPVDEDGLIIQNPAKPFISVIQTLK